MSNMTLFWVCVYTLSAYALFRAVSRRHGSLVCRELLGHNISTAEGFRQVKEKNLLETRCLHFVNSAAEILKELL